MAQAQRLIFGHLVQHAMRAQEKLVAAASAAEPGFVDADSSVLSILMDLAREASDLPVPAVDGGGHD